MREILFKAKRVDDGKWVEGYLIVIGEKAYIICQAEVMCTDNENTDLYATEWYEVDKNTICQDTGLIDNNGNKIWENDIVTFEDTGEDGYEYKEGFDFKNRAKVVFEKGRWELSDFLSDNSYIFENMNNHEELFALWDYVEVTGNTFDNAEVGCK